MRRLLIAIAVCLLGAGGAAAGDYADRMVIGFSPDGAYFAFEEYGVREGSGFPYSSIYVLETATNNWLADTPIYVRIQDETATLQSVRDLAYAQAEPLLSQFSIREPGRHLVHNPITVLSHSVEFLLRAYHPFPDSGWMLTLDEIALPASCPPARESFVGFDLHLAPPVGAPVHLNHDTVIPDSRGCPVGYGISDVIAFDRQQETVLIILLNLFAVGFEGPDRRFLAMATTVTE